MDDWDFGILLFCIVIPVLLLVKNYRDSVSQWRRIERTEERYKVRLKSLRANPGDSGLRERTLEAGRAFARAARDGGQETIFDEVALLNDINAIAGSSVGLRHDPPPPKRSVRERLQQLEELKQDGLITDVEYQERRSAILAET